VIAASPLFTAPRAGTSLVFLIAERTEDSVKVKPVLLTALVAVALTLVPAASAYASCAMAAERLTSATRVVEEEVTRLAPWKPGSDPRDAAWLKDNLVAMVPDWLPNTRAFATRVKPEIDRVLDGCYRPGDHSAAGPVRFEFVSCAKKGALTQLASTSPAEWSAICGEARAAIEDPAFEDKLRAWLRVWVDRFIQYAQTRPAPAAHA
jgi:hypothetical protein